MAESDRNLDHLYVQGYVEMANFHRQGGGGAKHLREVDRQTHGSGLRRSTKAAFDTSDEQKTEVLSSDEELRSTGTFIVLEGEGASHPLKLDSLSRSTGGTHSKPMWLLLSVRGDEECERATVWVADAYRAKFLQIFEDYLNDEKQSPNGHPKNRDLVANIATIRQAVLDDLWTSDGEPPRRGLHWWELWLDGNSSHAGDIDRFVEAHKLQSRKSEFRLGDRLIVWVQATWDQLISLPFTSVPLTEVRRPEFIDTVEDVGTDEQAEYVLDLGERVAVAPEDATAVCHLDTGVLRSHVLLRESLAPEDHLSIFGGSGTDAARNGHGTSMAGLALYGDLEPLLTSSEHVKLTHRLESVRMYPMRGEKPLEPIDYGTATVSAVSLPEAGRSKRRRAFSLTLSTSPDRPGEPTLWSASVDALAAGTDIVRDGDQLQLLSTPEPKNSRLLVVAAGNVSEWDSDYRTNSINTPVQDPAQAWNALTVGAYTDRDQLPSHPQYAGWTTVADRGDISPHTSTSMYFDHKKWPVKPDICMEGGNVLTDGNGLFEVKLPLLAPRTTGHQNDSALATANATSAATAQATRLAALAMERYPSYWPETVRGLLTHSAEWTEKMRQQLEVEHGKGARQRLLRQFGWGVPSEEAVLNSSHGAVTMLSQDSFIPFSGKEYSMRHFRLHPLPWPTEVLQELGATPVRLRVTLSYFIEPNASRRGWRNKYQYASHSLRFDLQGRTENPAEFVQRVNREAQNEEGGLRASESDRWFLGERARHLGSLHQDEWTGTGAELAHCNHVAVYPVGGWWKNNSRKDRRDLPVRYALLLSLQTQEQGVDLYTPIATQLHVPIATAISGT